MDNFKFVNARQAKRLYEYKNTKEKLLKKKHNRWEFINFFTLDFDIVYELVVLHVVCTGYGQF
jgi:hypothetical protein